MGEKKSCREGNQLQPFNISKLSHKVNKEMEGVQLGRIHVVLNFPHTRKLHPFLFLKQLQGRRCNEDNGS